MLSHGHWDHVGGLNEVIDIIGDKVPLICHPQALSPKYFQGQDQIIDIGIQGMESKNHCHGHKRSISSKGQERGLYPLVFPGHAR